MGVQFKDKGFGPKALVLNTFEFLFRYWMISYFKVFHFIRWRGMHNIPLDGPTIVSCNHISLFDPPCMGICMTMRRVRFMAFYTFFKVPLLGPLISALGAYPIDTNKTDRDAYEKSLKILREDREMMVIFPEGGRTRCGSINPLKPGMARLALGSESWIVPAVILGPERMWSNLQCVPRPFVPITIKFYPAFRVKAVNSRAEIAKATEEINARVEKIWRRRIGAQERLMKRRGKVSLYTA